MVSHEELGAAFTAAANALGVGAEELGELAFVLGTMSEKELAFLPKSATAKTIVTFARCAHRSKGAAARLGVGNATGAGSLPAAAATVGLGVSTTADWPPTAAGGISGVAAGQSSRGTTDVGLLEAAFPSALYCITFTLYDGVDVAMRLVSHAKANGFWGEVKHLSTSRSDFTLLLKIEDEASIQTLRRFVSWLATEVPIHAPAVETTAVFAKAAEAAAARVEVTSDLSNPVTSDQELLRMYGEGQLTDYAAPEVRLALEKAAEAEEQREPLSTSSLGMSRASSSHE